MPTPRPPIILPIVTELAPEDEAALRTAYRKLEHPSFAARLSALLGVPLVEGYRLLPKDWQTGLQRAVDRALGLGLRVALQDLDRPRSVAQRRAAVTAAGAAGGFFGWPGLLVELPVTTVLLLRTIADAARAEGEDLRTVDARLACLEVFALGGPRESDDAAELGFVQLRAALALRISGTEVGPLLVARTSPATVAFVRAVGQRFGVVVGEKAAAQAVPILGAAAGASINLLFFQHFHDVATGRFALRRLERRYGEPLVRAAYARLQAEEAAGRHAAFTAMHPA